jgi:hypothetical protein
MLMYAGLVGMLSLFLVLSIYNIISDIDCVSNIDNYNTELPLKQYGTQIYTRK